MRLPFVIIGGGLSGLAAAIRLARFTPDVLLLERHHRLGGLNSYYHRNSQLLETGLHAVTNYAPATAKHAPLNKLLRQLRLRRSDFTIYPQMTSEIRFPNHCNLLFSNDFEVLESDIAQTFPESIDGFRALVQRIEEFDPFAPAPFRSARAFVASYIEDPLLTDMLLCPLMYYGSSIENDLDLGQFVILFRSIFQEGMFRPGGTIKTFLGIFENLLKEYGGTFRLNCGVRKIHLQGDTARAVELDSGELVECEAILSTVGLSETFALLGKDDPYTGTRRLGFVESIFMVKTENTAPLPDDRTIVFYNSRETFRYARPDALVDFDSGVLCFPANFLGRPPRPFTEIRMTHLADYGRWKELCEKPSSYRQAKDDTAHQSLRRAENLIGEKVSSVVLHDTFTPLTINRYTGKKEGAIYGCPTKAKDGTIGLANVFIAGTDQGFLGIVGSMLSGVSMANQHLLPKV